MKVKALAVGNTQVENNIFLAPMAGYTDYAFRRLAIKLGAGLTFTELVSAKGLMYIKVQAECDSNEDICKLVLFAKNCESLPFEWLDNDHFRLFVGNGKRRQCCDVVFDMKKITMKYYITKE